MAYKVGNPRNQPKGSYIINWPCTMPDPEKTGERKQRGSMKEDRLWYEGDDFKRPSGMSDYGFNRLVSQGFIYVPETAEVASDG